MAYELRMYFNFDRIIRYQGQCNRGHFWAGGQNCQDTQNVSVPYPDFLERRATDLQPIVCYIMLWDMSKSSFFHRRVTFFTYLNSDSQVFLYKNTLLIVSHVKHLYSSWYQFVITWFDHIWGKKHFLAGKISGNYFLT